MEPINYIIGGASGVVGAVLGVFGMLKLAVTNKTCAVCRKSTDDKLDGHGRELKEIKADIKDSNKKQDAVKDAVNSLEKEVTAFISFMKGQKAGRKDAGKG